MSGTVWLAIGIVFVIVWAFIAYEIYNAPLMPDDHDSEEEIKDK